MNRSSSGLSHRDTSLSIGKSNDGFLKFITAEGLSQRTIASYEYMLNHWLKYIGDRSVSEIQASDLTGYMAWLRTEYKPVRFRCGFDRFFENLTHFGMRDALNIAQFDRFVG